MGQPDFATEWDVIRVAAIRHGVEPFFLAAIRHTEAGGPGREMGVLLEGVETFDAQVNACAATISRYVTQYAANPLIRQHRADGTHYVAYSLAFVHYCGSQYAPIGVSNDPNNLNKNWVANMIAVYFDYVEGATDVLGAWVDA